MTISLRDVQGAVARAWCALPNGAKTMDDDLALAAADEVAALVFPEIDRLRALLTEARDELRDVYLHDLADRIDAALDGGAPCATCGGKRLDKSDVTRVLAGKVALCGGDLAEWITCPDCGGSGVAS